MISPETTEKLAEVNERLTMFIITLHGIMIAGVIFYLVIGIILYRKSKQKKGRAKIILRILAIFFWISSSMVLGRLIWTYVG